MPPLTSDQLGFYKEQGFLVLEEALPQGALQPLIDEFSETVNVNATQAVARGIIDQTFPDLPFETRLGRLVASASDSEAADAPSSVLFRNVSGKHKSPAMFELMTHPALLDIVESVIGPEILAHPQFNVRAKLPHQDRSVVPWHQDLGYLERDAEETFMVNFWLPLVDANQENGCLEVIAGSHRAPLINHASQLGPAGNFRGIQDADLPDGDHILCPVPRGGVLLIQHKTIHRSVPNVSSTVRWSLDLRYCDPAMPTGRDDVPGFITRSASHPESVTQSVTDWMGL